MSKIISICEDINKTLDNIHNSNYIDLPNVVEIRDLYNELDKLMINLEDEIDKLQGR